MLILFTILALYVSVSVFYVTLSAKFKKTIPSEFRKNIYLTVAYILCIWVLALYLLQSGWERGLATFLCVFAVIGPTVLISELILKERWIKTIPYFAGFATLIGVIVSARAML